MPHLTYPIVEPDGPIINVAVGISAVHAKVRMGAGMDIPQPFLARVLIDTGATCSCFDPTVVKQLGYEATGVAHILSPSTEGKPVLCLQYDMSITLIHPTLSRTFPNVQVAECEFKEFGIQGLIGRDILKHCLFIFDGQLGGVGGFTLSF